MRFKLLYQSNLVAQLWVIGILLMIAPANFAQNYWLKDAVIKRYHQPTANDSSVALSFGYGQYQIQNAEIWKKYREKVSIKKVELVFSAYPADTAVWNYGGLKNLQDKRIQALKDLDTVFYDNNIIFQNIIQTECLSRPACKQLFHGFIIHFQYKTPFSDSSPEDTTQNIIQKLIEFKIAVIQKFIDGNIPFKDSVVINTFLKHPEWNNILAIIDLTGSMYPYTAQLLRWIRTHQEKHKLVYLVFFNDGDDYLRYGGPKFELNPKYNKVIGKTGGIYAVPPYNFEEVLDTIHTAMLSGEGGDNPENDIEAVLYALKSYQANYQEVILIGDNQSSIRDLVLVSQITRPIRVVLCDELPNRAPHPDKVMLAFKTKGSIHGNQDEVDFADGKTTFTWQNKLYSIENEKVTQINNPNNTR